MQARKNFLGLSPVTLVILLGATVSFAIHLYAAPGYGFFSDEFYTIALSKHLAFGYVDLPPLVLVCLITREFGGKLFAVTLSALGFIGVPLWLGLYSIFCYDSLDQLILAGFLYALVRFLRTGDRRLWLLLGLIAGLACLTKMTILFLGPGFLAALLISKYRKDLLTPWPWLGAGLCLVMVTPYLLWQGANHWPTLEYWHNYGAYRVYQASFPQYLASLLGYMGLLLLPLWMVGLYRLFRRLEGVSYVFLGLMSLITLGLAFVLHASARMLAELFVSLIAAGAVFVEEKLTGLRWEKGLKALTITYLLVVGVLTILASLPILPVELYPRFADKVQFMSRPQQDFKGVVWRYSPLLTGRVGWEALVREVAKVYDGLPAEEGAVAGIYADWYMSASAIDGLGPQYHLPHVVSGSLNYYLWGPGYSWEVMIIVTGRINNLDVFFKECEFKAVVEHTFDVPVSKPYIHVCRKPVVPAKVIWSSMKSYR